ncbi:coiled-coil domain-containing protein 190-like [Protopterus annectens]|uniref:coiled-coil domain-containing protein 190-like n=1 Tax=Protopterus annectens TaxID=7888 RepID=UPI001CFAFCF6|nr:coiled-coil domain-containing protein 190-like [Protopterus annectens]
MQRTRLYGAQWDQGKHIDVERRDERRDEVKLKKGLNNLEEAHQYHMNTMMREQRRIQKDLSRIRQGYSKNKPVFRTWAPGAERERSSIGPKKTLLPTISSGGGTESPGWRTQRSFSTKKSIFNITAGQPHTLQMRINSFIEDVSSRKDLKSTAQTPEVPERISTPIGMRKVKTESSIADINMSNIKLSIAKRLSISREPSQEGFTSDNSTNVASVNQDKASEDGNAREVFQQNASLQPLSNFLENPDIDTEAFAPDGNLRTMHTLPNFMDSLAEAKKARYIRYRGFPESERELTVTEIFGQERKSFQRSSPGEDVAKTLKGLKTL